MSNWKSAKINPLDSQNIRININEDVGTMVVSPYSLADFQELYGSGWVLCDGGDCTGSRYSNKTGLNTVPNEVGVLSSNIFIKIN
jgi:hypothetical protein